MTVIDALALVPPPGERAMFVGQTGCGKTELAKRMLWRRKFVVVLDTKGTLTPEKGWGDYRMFRTLDALTTANAEKFPRLLYRPSYQDMADEEEMEAFFAWVYQRQNCLVYVDELMSITRGDVFPPSMGAILTRGRERRTEFWAATQRPIKIPQVTLSEAEHVYGFRLRLPQDRQRVEDLAGIPVERIAALPKHYFCYSRQDADVVGPLHLALRKGA